MNGWSGAGRFVNARDTDSWRAQGADLAGFFRWRVAAHADRDLLLPGLWEY